MKSHFKAARHWLEDRVVRLIVFFLIAFAVIAPFGLDYFIGFSAAALAVIAVFTIAAFIADLLGIE